mgnify:CR=1 FL=1
MAKTRTLDLFLVDPAEWNSVYFKDFLNALAGSGDASNMAKIDAAIAALQSAKADLVDGLIPASQLPSYVDDVLEGTISEDASSFTLTGESSACIPETGKIYVDTAKNITYRWSGSLYVPIGSDLALGETESTAYRGDRGKEAYEHISRKDNPHGVTASQIGLGSVDNTADLDKPVSTATQTALNAINAQLGDISSVLDAINGEAI